MFPSKYNNMVLFLAATMAFGMTLRDRRTGGLVHLLACGNGLVYLDGP